MKSEQPTEAICGACRERVDVTTEVCPCCSASPLLDGRYLLREILGNVGERSTYRATRVEDDVDVAVKELLFQGLTSFKAEELFRREIEVLRQLRHPSIPQIFDAFATRDGKVGGLYAVRELVHGRSLQEEMLVHQRSPREVAAIGAELLDIIAFLHGLTPPLIHRDLTPSNVLRRAEDGRLMLIDFGSVKESVSRQGSTVGGTYGYMAPEQFRGVASKASDTYGVGALMLALLTGRPAHELVDERHRLSVAEHVPRGAMRLLLEDMLCVDPSRRSKDAGALAKKLRQIAQGVHPPGGVRLIRTACLVLLPLGLLLGGITIATGRGDVTPRPREELKATAAEERSPQPELSKVIAMPPPSPLALSPAPPPSPDWAPECDARGDCHGVGEEFAGMTLEGACAHLVVRDREVEHTLKSRSTHQLDVGGRELSCEASLQSNRFCNVVCGASGDDGQDDDLELVRWIGDRYGTYTKSHSQPYQRRYSFERLDDGWFGRRSWTWDGDGRDLVMIANRYPGSRDKLTLSYRGVLRDLQADDVELERREVNR